MGLVWFVVVVGGSLCVCGDVHLFVLKFFFCFFCFFPLPTWIRKSF